MSIRVVTMPGPYAVICECGDRVPVVEREFGGRTKCKCGLFLVVPLADEFCRRPVQPTANTVLGRVKTLNKNGLFPSTCSCVRCDQPAIEQTISVRVECERSRATGGVSVADGIGHVLLAVVMMPSGVFMHLQPEEEPFRILGRNTTVELPVRLCPPCHQELTMRSLVVTFLLVVGGVISAVVGVTVGFWWAVPTLLVTLLFAGFVRVLGLRRRQMQWKRCLNQEPAYRQLLGHYKFATIHPPHGPP